MTTTSPPVNVPYDRALHRQRRPADPDLASLYQRITALQWTAKTNNCVPEVERLTLRYSHLERDRGQQTAQWFTDAANLRLAIEREERAEATNA